MFEVGSIVARVKADLTDFKHGMNEAKSLAGKVGQGFKSAEAGSFALLGAVAAVGAGVAAFGVSSVKAYMDAEEAAAQLNAVIKSTGGAAGLTSQELQKQASALQAVTKFSDEAVMAAQAMLLTFTQLKGDVLKEATVLTLDFAQAMGTDAKSAALQLGKALNDPSNGLTKLQRAGVTFTDQQKEQIKAMQAAGDTAGAQRTILAELRKEFGGSAEAAGGTFAGKLAILKNTFGDLQETVGGFIVTALMPLADAFSRWIEKVNEAGGLAPYLQQGFKDNETVIYALAGAVLFALIPAFVALGAAIWTALAPLLPFIAIGAALGLLFKVLKDNGIDPLKIAMDYLTLAWQVAKPPLMELWATIQNELIPALKKLWNEIGPTLLPLLKDLAIFIGVVMIVHMYVMINVIRLLVSALAWLINTWVEVERSLNRVRGAILGAVSGFGSMLYNAGRDLIYGLIRGIESVAPGVLNKMAEIARGAINAAKSILGIKSPSTVFKGIGENLGLGLIGGIQNTAGAVQGAINAMVPTSMDMAAVTQSTNVSTNIYGNIINGSEADRDIFFKRLTRGQEAAARGAAAPAGSN